MAERFTYFIRDALTDPSASQKPQFNDDTWNKIDNQIRADVHAAIASRPQVPEVARGDMSDDYEIARIAADLGVAAKIDLTAEAAHVTAINENAAKAKAEKQLSIIREQLRLIEGGKHDVPFRPMPKPQPMLAQNAAS